MTRAIAVVGAGTMGSGIAIVAARALHPTILFDVSESTLEGAIRQITAFLDGSVKRSRLSGTERDHVLERLVPTTDMADLSDAQLVIEAVYEDMAVKASVLNELNAVCRSDAIFASNTSTLSITELASASQRADRFVGMHFCLPAQVMKLVEMTPGLITDPSVFEVAWALCEAMGQRPVKTQDRPGFILNRYLVPFNNDAIRLIERGTATPEDVDRAVKGALGYPMGPCELLDYIGLDTQVLLSEALFRTTNDPRAACPPLLRRMVAAGHLGRKAGRGFFEYDRPAFFGA
jgi:3-hydroxybutyryl-CoA dehydrogenase